MRNTTFNTKGSLAQGIRLKVICLVLALLPAILLSLAQPAVAAVVPTFLFKIPEQLSSSNPISVVIAPDGAIWVTHTNHNQIAKFYPSNPGGELRIGTAGSGDGQFNYPSGVALDGLGNVYVADSSNNRIQVFQVNRPPPDLPPW